MIKKMFYSTLNDEYYDTRSEAQKAEDKFVEQHFRNLELEAERKRRMRAQLLQKPTKLSI